MVVDLNLWVDKCNGLEENNKTFISDASNSEYCSTQWNYFTNWKQNKYFCKNVKRLDIKSNILLTKVRACDRLKEAVLTTIGLLKRTP